MPRDGLDRSNVNENTRRTSTSGKTAEIDLSYHRIAPMNVEVTECERSQIWLACRRRRGPARAVRRPLRGATGRDRARLGATRRPGDAPGPGALGCAGSRDLAIYRSTRGALPLELRRRNCRAACAEGGDGESESAADRVERSQARRGLRDARRRRARGCLLKRQFRRRRRRRRVRPGTYQGLGLVPGVQGRGRPLQRDTQGRQGRLDGRGNRRRRVHETADRAEGRQGRSRRGDDRVPGTAHDRAHEAPGRPGKVRRRRSQGQLRRLGVEAGVRRRQGVCDSGRRGSDGPALPAGSVHQVPPEGSDDLG